MQLSISEDYSLEKALPRGRVFGTKKTWKIPVHPNTGVKKAKCMNFRAVGAKNRIFSESEGILVGKSREFFGSFEVAVGVTCTHFEALHSERITGYQSKWTSFSSARVSCCFPSKSVNFHFLC